ncbi:MAG: hypothetical protein HY886_06385, partial [Deltaproteobacteria bacterium]|nr:hypothetical protein [Deltaproteobacteria bacterium]
MEVQKFLQRILEEEVAERLGRGRSQRKSAVDCNDGCRNGYGKPRRLSEYAQHQHRQPFLGRGNPLGHPRLFWFLSEALRRGIIANLTVNQRHLKPYMDDITKMFQYNLVKGLGVSLAEAGKRSGCA